MEPLQRDPRQAIGSREAALTQSGFMSKVYLWMGFGLFTTAYTSYVVSNSQALLSLIFGSGISLTLILLGQIGVVLALSFLAQRVSTFTATLLFFLYALMNGLTFSAIFLMYTHQSIMTAFGVTGGMFVGLSAFGFLTKKDLGPVGTFMLSALWGLLLGMVINIFLHNTVLDLMLSGVGVLIFSGLTAYDTQKIKAIGQTGFGNGNASKGAIYGALILYLDFINLFMFLLRFLGDRRR